MKYELHSLIGVEVNVPRGIKRIIHPPDYFRTDKELCNINLWIRSADKTEIGDFSDQPYSVKIGKSNSILRPGRTSSLIKLAIQMALLKENCTLVHSAGVTKKGKVYLMTGRGGGVGKTSNTFALLKRGWGLMGDENVIVDERGKIMSYPTRIAVYFDTKNFKLPKMKRMELIAREVLGKVTPVFRAVGVNPRKFEITDEGNLNKVFFLSYGEGELSEIDPSKIISFVSDDTARNLLCVDWVRKMFHKYCNKHNKGFSENWLKRKIREVLTSAFKKGKKHYLVPSKNKTHFESIMEMVS